MKEPGLKVELLGVGGKRQGQHLCWTEAGAANPRAQARALLQAPYLSLTPKQQISARSAFMRLLQLCSNTNLGLAEGGGCRTIALGLSEVLLQGAP